LAVAAVLTAGGVTAAVAGQPDARQAPPAQPQTRVVTILDAPPVTLDPEPTTTTTTPPPAPTQAAGQASGSGSATITVIINR
jgi:hypothetical protein